MTMTQERANEIAYLGCIRDVIRYCDTKGINEVTAPEKLLRGNIEEEFVEDIANVLHLEREEAIEFTRFVFRDVAKAIAKRKEETVVRIKHIGMVG